MATEEMAAVLAQELSYAERPDLAANQARALQFYDCEKGTVNEGWSDLVSSDVRDAVESSIAELMGAINPDEPLGWFDAVGEDDVERAELETWAVHTALFGRNRGMVVLEQVLRDCLLSRYGIVKAWVHTDTREDQQTIQGIDAEAMYSLLNREQRGVTFDVQIVKDRGDGTVDADITRTESKQSLRIDAVAPENFRWSNDLRGPFLGAARFLAERVYRSRAELRELGIDDADDLPAAPDVDPVASARHADNPSELDRVARAKDTPVEVWLCWVKNLKQGGYDCHEFVLPSRVVRSYWREFHPYAGGVAILRPHRFDGVSVYDRIGPIQETKTYLLRQLATQARLTNQTRIVVRDRCVNPEDLGNDALNPVIRVTGIPAECMVPMPVLDITSQLLASMQWIDSLRREAGGASIDMTSPELQIAGQSAHAAEREYSFRELQAQSILRTFGDTLVRSLYLLAHATIKDAMTDALDVPAGGKWAQADPAQWPSRTDVAIDIGQPLGVKSRRQAALMQTVALQSQALQAGGAGLLVGLPDVYRANVDLGKMSGLRNAKRYWTDPDSREAAQKAQQQQQAAQQQAQAAQEQQAAVLATTQQIEKLKSETEILKQRMDDSTKVMIEKMKTQEAYFEAILRAVASEQEIEGAINEAGRRWGNGADDGAGASGRIGGGVA